MRKRLTQEKILERFNEAHGDRYDYKLVEFKTVDDPVTIICSLHGEFSQTPYNHYNGKYCPRCTNQLRGKKDTREDFISKSISVHGDKYDYSLVKYVNNKTKVILKCKIPEHKPFSARPDSHLYNKQGCPECANISKRNSKLKGLDFYIERFKSLHKDEEGNPLYDYSKAVYEDYHKPITVICPKEGHGKFYPTIANHGSSKDPTRCPKCSNSRYSKPEYSLIEFLRSLDLDPIHNKRMYGRYPDILLEDYKLIIEHNGNVYHHSNLTNDKFLDRNRKDPNYHLDRYSFFNDKGYTVLYIFEFEDLDKWKKSLELYFKNPDKYNILFSNRKRTIPFKKNTLEYYGQSYIERKPT